MRIFGTLLLCGLFASSCNRPAPPQLPSATTANAPASASATDKSPEVPLVTLLEFETRRQGQIVKESPDAKLVAGQDFAIRLSAEGPVYVYAVKTLPNKKSEVLDPAAPQNNRQRPAGKLRVPDGEGWLRVDAPPPDTKVCLLIATRLLAPAELDCSYWATRGPDEQAPPPVAQPRGPEPPPPPPPPDRGRRSSSVTSLQLSFESR